MRYANGLALAALGLAVIAGCNPAGRYNRPRGPRDTGSAALPPAVPITTKASATETKRPTPVVLTAPDAVWEDPDPRALEPPVPIRFVTAADREQWQHLPGFWNVSTDVGQRPTPEQAAVLVGAAPWNIGALVGAIDRVVKVKVPLGLDAPHAPASNPPTVGKWELGKQLFFDQELFLQPATAENKTSCAACHDPAKGFSSDKPARDFGDHATPQLLNAGLQAYQFWDGRADALEEVVFQSVAERPGPARHHWTGVVNRLRDNPYYDRRFRQVFGTRPTQDAVAKALATYLRTLLSGDSLQDRAEAAARQRGAKAPEPADYEKLLDKDALKSLAVDEGLTKEEVAKQLHQGYTLFHGTASCAACHGGSAYTDNSFHNLGVGDSAGPVLIGNETGRFAVLPVGLKDRRMVGAYKTPSLRSLSRTGPFFHDGLRSGPDALFEVIAFHVKGGKSNSFLDPAIRDLGLKEADVRALVVFVQGLKGEPLPASLIEPLGMPERIPAPKK